MGSVSSRNQVVTTPDPSPVHTRTRPNPVRQITIEKIVTEDGAEVGELRPVLRESHDWLENDKDLEDIQDLEQTFDSLGIQANSDCVKEGNLDRLETRWNENTVERAVRTVSGLERLDIPSATLNNNNSSSKTNFNNSKSAPTKFSWSLKDTTSAPDEWICQKSIVDGFDPDKFRKVNKKDSPDSGDVITASRAEDVVLLHPHSVPQYDTAEQHILDSIEPALVTMELVSPQPTGRESGSNFENNSSFNSHIPVNYQ